MTNSEIKKEEAMNTNIKNVTVTIIFDGAALNRDEKIGGNILSIKKLNVNGEVRSFIGKPAIRHYLFQTLYKQDPETWRPTPVIERGSGDKKTLQFDLTRADIITYAELDAFGYMFTIEGERSLTRKSPIGITKAISLGSYEADLAFYANHDLVMRRRSEGYPEIMPGLYNKEEHISYYKLSFTIDTEVLGKDVWILGKPEPQDGELSIKISESDEKKLKGKLNGTDSWEVGENEGTIKWIELQQQKYRLIFEVSKAKNRERMRAILEAIKNGLYAQSSGEANSIVPLFLIAGAVKVPSPVFHAFIDVKKENGRWKVVGVSDALKNSWLEKKNSGDPIVYIQDCERLSVDRDLRSGKDDWEQFLNDVGLGNSKKEKEGE